ncbi:hypothetical protein QBC47DRAFT_385064 [Echria macrotheca]|uniref:Oxidoreductase n=1 Tax=Echria macrotheca TaxID=438768 RepID=A0AAJ0B8W2_9PEZI|nr:hypothetical protein QBC47DRAFT_385064 [Echria macrotheca]
MSTTVYNVGVIGYGLSAKVFHIPFVELTPSLKLYAIVQRHPAPGNSAPEDFPTSTTGVAHLTSVDALLADPAVDVVIITTPPNTHFELASAALRHGKHVLVEKPFVPTSKQAYELDALARERGVVLCVYQNRRWDSDFLTVQHLVATNELGRIVEFETHFDRLRLEKPTSWKGSLKMDEGGGVLYDLGTHLLDQVFVLFGMPSAVSAKFVNQREGRIAAGEEPDSVSIVLTYAATGLLVFVRIGVISVETHQMRFWVRGTKGSYHKTGLDSQEDHLRGGGRPTDSDFGRESISEFDRLCIVGEDGRVERRPCPTVEPQTYRRFYERFAKAIATRDPSDIPVPATEAAKVLAIIEAARESARTSVDTSPIVP